MCCWGRGSWLVEVAREGPTDEVRLEQGRREVRIWTFGHLQGRELEPELHAGRLQVGVCSACLRK